MATQAEIAEHLDLSQQAISALLARGVLPAASRKGGLDRDACRVAYIRHLREQAAGRASAAAEDEGLDLVAERARLAKEQADAQAMRNAILRGELVSAEDLETVAGAIVDAIRAKILALPTRATPLVIGLNSHAEIRDKLTDLMHEALTELVATEIVSSVEDHARQRVRRGRAAAAVVHSGEVGG